jgi:hypothetical protein
MASPADRSNCIFFDEEVSIVPLINRSLEMEEQIQMQRAHRH